jgi:hypothetical protein
MGDVVLRPVVPITFVGSELAPTVLALADSGCEHVLAAPWIATATGVDVEATHKTLVLGIGGDNVNVRFHDLTIRLHPEGGSDRDYIEWQCEVGFPSTWRPTWQSLVGQVGFFDRFTVTMSRFAQQMAIEPLEVFDSRFGVPYLGRPTG